MDRQTSPPQSDPNFSWERWVIQGLQALRSAMFRHDLGLPEEFWYHLERAMHELITAGRILLRTLRVWRRGPVPPDTRGPIDIDWE